MKLESLALHHGYESEATTKSAAVPLRSQLSGIFECQSSLTVIQGVQVNLGSVGKVRVWNAKVRNGTR